MKRRMFLSILGGLALSFGSLYSQPGGGGVITNPWKCERKTVNKGGANAYEYEYINHGLHVPGLVPNTTYRIVFKVEADSLGDELTTVEQSNIGSGQFGVVGPTTISVSVRNPSSPANDTPIPWAASHYHCKIELWRPVSDGWELDYETDVIRVEVEYPLE